MPFEYIRIGNADREVVFVKLKGLYAIDPLAAEYGRLPGVVGADKSNLGGDGPTICVTSGPDTLSLRHQRSLRGLPRGLHRPRLFSLHDQRRGRCDADRGVEQQERRRRARVGGAIRLANRMPLSGGRWRSRASAKATASS